eukprot:352159-Chlamydomonas_euryale.AAC.10
MAPDRQASLAFSNDLAHVQRALARLLEDSPQAVSANGRLRSTESLQHDTQSRRKGEGVLVEGGEEGKGKAIWTGAAGKAQQPVWQYGSWLRQAEWRVAVASTEALCGRRAAFAVACGWRSEQRGAGLDCRS